MQKCESQFVSDWYIISSKFISQNNTIWKLNKFKSFHAFRCIIKIKNNAIV